RENQKSSIKRPFAASLAKNNNAVLYSCFPKWILPNNTPKSHLNVVNLSKYSLTTDEQFILEKGLSFCPSRRLDPINLCSNLSQFIRKIRLKEYFKDTPEPTTNSTTYKTKTGTQKNLWVPPKGRNPYIDSFANAAKSHLNSFIQKYLTNLQPADNLSKNQPTAIKNLHRNQDIIIKPADEGGNITIMDRTEYITEIETQLSNQSFYRCLSSDPTYTYKKDCTNMVSKLTNTNIKSKVRALISDEPKAGVIYILPKLHKLPKLVGEALVHINQSQSCNADMLSDPTYIYNLARSLNTTPPGRPIISGNSTLTENISGYVDSILNPLLVCIPSFIQDTTHFLKKLNDIPPLPNHALLVTLDACSLYTNIPHDEGIAACEKFISTNDPAQSSPDISKLIKFILTHSNFVFHDKHYQQISGTAMGTKMAPCYANIFMAELEDRLLANSNPKPSYYCRYIDDIFFIWEHGIDKLNEFERFANNFHPRIKFTINSSKPLEDPEIELETVDGNDIILTLKVSKRI
ncbi:uncharacterized protein LOC117116665, partial [Anneissia japonica]|uniref:uncharacterized protein LOC117116665 n=1 Tax=Anneissia japonica TaxID=1529436 RepID=UPI00142556A9